MLIDKGASLKLVEDTEGNFLNKQNRMSMARQKHSAEQLLAFAGSTHPRLGQFCPIGGTSGKLDDLLPSIADMLRLGKQN